ncbi:MAG TPA: GNAT family N-acetyltransferase [Actinomycetales bacterium]|jgi:phosphinothricin acetyltransferase
MPAADRSGPGETLVRPAVPDDAGAVAGIYATYVEGGYATFEEQAPTADEVAARMTGAPRLPWLVATRDDAVVGFAYAASHRPRAAYRWTVETSVYLRSDETGRGTGRALYDVLLAAVRDLGHVTALAAIAQPNPASVRLHESLGFTCVGLVPGTGFKHGRWRDLGWWALPLQPVRPTPPAEPRPWG